jgi:hypothetical protein
MIIYPVNKTLKTDASPCIVAQETVGNLYNYFLAWKIEGMGGQNILVSNSGDGMNWSAPTTIHGEGWVAQTDKRPSLTIDNSGNLWAAWKGTEDDQIWYSYTVPYTSITSPNWSQQQIFYDSGGVAPKIASAPSITWNDGIYPILAWREADNSIWYAQIQVGPWGTTPVGGPIPSTSISEHTKEAPALATWSQGNLTFAWRDASDNNLWYKTFSAAAPWDAGATPRRQVLVTSSDQAVESGNSPALAWAPPGLAWRGTDQLRIWISNDFPGPPITQQEVDDTATTEVSPALIGAAGIIANVVAFKKPHPDNTLWTFIAPG